MFNQFYKKYFFSNFSYRFSTLLSMKRNNSKFSNFSNIQKFYFNKPTSPSIAGQQTTPATPPQKTKDQLKVEKLMEQWPEWIRNAPKENLMLTSIKRSQERIYKFHQGDKNYLKDEDLPHDLFQEVSTCVMATFTTDTIASLFEEYEGFLTDHWIVTKLFQIALTHKDLTDEFFKVILPQVKETLKKADKSSGTILYLAGYAASILNISDKEFWDIYEYKMIKERLYRYLTIEQMVQLSQSLATADKGSDTLFRLFEVNFIKHRRYLSLKPKLKTSVLATYYFRLRGSHILYEALENPNIEVPAIDPKIPLMNRGLHQGHVRDNQKQIGH